MKKLLLVFTITLLLAGCAARSLPTGEETEDVAVSRSTSEAVHKPEQEAVSRPDEAEKISAGQSSGQPENVVISQPAAPEAEEWALVLVNSAHAIGDYEPTLAEVQGVYRMDVRVADAMKRMLADAGGEGVSLLVCSAYRPYSSQKRNFDAHVASNIAAGMTRENAIAATKTLIAEPGKSEHQTGLAADIVTPAYQGLDSGYADTAAAKWLLKNAADYGFILRYPKDKTAITGIAFEPWHYRYVGVPTAQTIMEQGLCLEEFLDAA